MSLVQHLIERPDGGATAFTDRVILGAKQVAFDAAGGSVSSVNVPNAGSYTAMISVATTGPGSGAIFAPKMKAIAAAVVAAGTQITPNDTFTLVSGTGTNPTARAVTTKVVSATISAAGSGGVNGLTIVNGTTGSGATKFQLNVTISGGQLTAINSINIPGSYTANPTSIVTEPVFGGSLTGATVSLVMGTETAVLLTAGSVSTVNTNPVVTTPLVGAGSGTTFNVTYGIDGIGVTAAGMDYTSASNLTITGAGTGGGAATLVLSNQGIAKTIPVTFSGLTINSYTVSVNPGQNCNWYVPQSSKTSTGFNVVLQPSTTTSLVAGTIDVTVIS